MHTVASGIRHRSIALFAAGALASCVPLAVTGVVTGTLATVGGCSFVAGLECDDDDADDGLVCSEKANGVFLMVIGLASVIVGGFYLIEVPR